MRVNSYDLEHSKKVNIGEYVEILQKNTCTHISLMYDAYKNECIIYFGNMDQIIKKVQKLKTGIDTGIKLIIQQVKDCPLLHVQDKTVRNLKQHINQLFTKN